VNYEAILMLSNTSINLEKFPHLKLILAFCFGGLAALGQAPWSMWGFTLLGFSGSFCLTGLDWKFRSAATLGFFTGLGYFSISLFWIVEPFLVDWESDAWIAPFALLILSGGLSAFWALAYGLSASLVERRNGVLSLIIFLTAAEICRTKLFTGFPWALIGYVWTDHPILQLAAFGGPHLLTFITLLIAGLPLLLRLKLILRVISAATILMCCWIYGIVELGHNSNSYSNKFVRLIQPNASQNLKWDSKMIPIFWKRQLELTGQPSENELDLIIWPETSISVLLSDADMFLKAISKAALGKPVVIGAHDKVDGSVRNAMVVLGPDGEILDVYHKQHLVPFGEYVPFGEILSAFGINGLAARDGSGFEVGTGERALDIPNIGRVLPLICYELIFPRHLITKIRPSVILQITNDAWFGSASGPYQHLHQAKARAVEQGIPLIRVANTGISAVIDPWGNIVSQTRMNESAYLDVNIPGIRSATFYSKYSDWPILMFIFFGIAFCVVLKIKDINY